MSDGRNTSSRSASYASNAAQVLVGSDASTNSTATTVLDANNAVVNPDTGAITFRQDGYDDLVVTPSIKEGSGESPVNLPDYLSTTNTVDDLKRLPEEYNSTKVSTVNGTNFDHLSFTPKSGPV